MTFETVFIILFGIATAVAMVARWTKTPYTVALVVSGVVLASVHVFEPPHLTKEMLYAVFLPGLLFEAAFHLEVVKVRTNKLAIITLAVPGVAVAMVLTGLAVAPTVNAFGLQPGFGFIHALVFGALIAATDPIAVVAMFKSFGAPKRLGVLVEAESLLNDGTAVVFFTMVMAWANGKQVSAAGAALDFVRIVGMGALIGALIAFAASAVIFRVDDAMIEITLTTIAAYGSFVAAEQFHFSGVIATVVAGLVLGNYARTKAMTPASRVAVESFWEYIAFALNSVVFLLIGFEERLDALLASWKIIVIAYLAVTLARATVVGAVTAMLSRSKERMPWRWGAVMTWGGLRGALSMVLALATPQSFPYRETLIRMTFGVVILSLLLQGLTMSTLLRRLGIVGEGADHEAYEWLRGQRRTITAALSALADMVQKGTVRPDAATTVRADYEATAREVEEKLQALHVDSAELAGEETRALRRSLLLVEKDALLEEQRLGRLGAHAVEKLLRDVDARSELLDAYEEGRTVPKPPGDDKPEAAD